jgi:hypothetical protein
VGRVSSVRSKQRRMRVPLVIWGMAAAASGFMLPCAHVGRCSTLISGPAKRSFSAPLVHRHVARRRASMCAVQASAAVCAPVLSHTPPLSFPARCAQPLCHIHSSLNCPRPRIHQREMAVCLTRHLSLALSAVPNRCATPTAH